HPDRHHLALEWVSRWRWRQQLQKDHRAAEQNRKQTQESEQVRFRRRQIWNPEKRCLAKVDRDRECRVKRKKKRHLNQQRQTSAERVRLFHQTQLLHLQLLHARISLLHSLQFFLKLFHPRRVLLCL